MFQGTKGKGEKKSKKSSKTPTSSITTQMHEEALQEEEEKKKIEGMEAEETRQGAQETEYAVPVPEMNWDIAYPGSKLS